MAFNELSADHRRQYFSDRFSDEMCERLLCFLLIEDKIKLECVSKQFQKTIYVKQTEFIYEDFPINVFRVPNPDYRAFEFKYNAFESVFKKCQFINKIIIRRELYYHENFMLKIITKYCKQLNTIEFYFNNVSKKTLKEFRVKFGPTFEEIILESDSPKTIKKLFGNDPSVSAFHNLSKFDFILDSYQKTIQSLKIKIDYFQPTIDKKDGNSEIINSDLIKAIAEFVNLHTLSLTFENINTIS